MKEWIRSRIIDVMVTQDIPDSDDIDDPIALGAEAEMQKIDRETRARVLREKRKREA